MQDLRALGDGRASDYQGEAVFARGLVLFKVLTIGVVATTGILPWGPLSPCLSVGAPGESTDLSIPKPCLQHQENLDLQLCIRWWRRSISKSPIQSFTIYLLTSHTIKEIITSYGYTDKLLEHDKLDKRFLFD